jgi:hypothetical protein
MVIYHPAAAEDVLVRVIAASSYEIASAVKGDGTEPALAPLEATTLQTVTLQLPTGEVLVNPPQGKSTGQWEPLAAV